MYSSPRVGESDISLVALRPLILTVSCRDWFADRFRSYWILGTKIRVKIAHVEMNVIPLETNRLALGLSRAKTKTGIPIDTTKAVDVSARKMDCDSANSVDKFRACHASHNAHRMMEKLEIVNVRIAHIESRKSHCP